LYFTKHQREKHAKYILSAGKNSKKQELLPVRAQAYASQAQGVKICVGRKKTVFSNAFLQTS
jgi:hypothetical protein